MRYIIRRIPSLVALPAAVIGLLSAAQCGGSSTSPTNSGTAISAVSLSTPSVAAGGSEQGTVTLSAAPSTGATVTLASSNAAVATVPASVAIAAGASTATFTISAVAPGTAAITASMNGSSSQSPALTVTARVTLVAITVASPSVVGGDSINGTVKLSGPAPTAGAVVTLSGGDPITLPSSVMVPSGAISTTFSAFTRGVGGTISSTITGSYEGSSASVVVAITPPTTATANFGVTGPTETETCTLINGGNTINCTFNGSTSTAPGTIVAWDWTYGVAKTFSRTTTGPVLAMPAVDCSVIPAPPLPPAPASQWFSMVVTLVVHDNLGNVSPPASDRVVRLFPQGVCGF
jgi:trimeric autotransporter adhesin